MNVPSLTTSDALYPARTFEFCTPECRDNALSEIEYKYQSAQARENVPADGSKCYFCGKDLCIIMRVIPARLLSDGSPSPLWERLCAFKHYYDFDVTDLFLMEPAGRVREMTDDSFRVRSLYIEAFGKYLELEGAYSVSIAESVKRFFGVDALDRISAPMMASRRWKDVGALLTAQDFEKAREAIFALEEQLPDGHPDRKLLFQARIKVREAEFSLKKK